MIVLHFQDFRIPAAAERTDFQSVLSKFPEGFPAGGWRSRRKIQKCCEGIPAGIPEQQLNSITAVNTTRHHVPEARWRIYIRRGGGPP